MESIKTLKNEPKNSRNEEGDDLQNKEILNGLNENNDWNMVFNSISEILFDFFVILS